MFTGHGWLAGWNRGIKLGDGKGIIICGNGEKLLCFLCLQISCNGKGSSASRFTDYGRCWTGNKLLELLHSFHGS